jgi:hypothetical protein
MRTLAIAATAMAIALPALADEPYHPGTWVCETNGICINPQSLQRRGTKVEAQAVIPYRNKNHLAVLVRDCLSTNATTRGVPWLAEDAVFPVGHEWMCSE